MEDRTARKSLLPRIDPARHNALRVPGNFFIRADEHSPIAQQAFELLTHIVKQGRFEYFDIGYAEKAPKRIERAEKRIAEHKGKKDFDLKIQQGSLDAQKKSLECPNVEFSGGYIGKSAHTALTSIVAKLSSAPAEQKEAAAELLLGAMVDGYKNNKVFCNHQYSTQLSPRMLMDSTVRSLVFLLGGEATQEPSKVLVAGLETSTAQKCVRLGLRLGLCKSVALEGDRRDYGLQEYYTRHGGTALKEVFTLLWQDFLPPLAEKFNASRHGPGKEETLALLTAPTLIPRAAAEVVATVPSAAPINYRKLSPNFPINDGKLTTTEDISVFINFEAAPSKETIEKLTELGLDITFVPGRKILTGDLKKDANIGAILEVAEVKRIAQSQQFSPPTDPTARHPASPL
jgi:hypothetical protein